MKCPSCNHRLKGYQYHGLDVDTCVHCSGMWFDPEEMKAYVDFLLEDRRDIAHAKIELDRDVLTSHNTTGPTKVCPRCNEPMKAFNYSYDSNIMLDRCLACGGVWTDAGEIYKLATYVKGNPRLDALGDSIIEDRKKANQLKDLAEVSSSLQGSAAALIFLPKIILPLTDNIQTRIIPGVVFTIIIANFLIFLYQFIVAPDVSMFVNRFGLTPSVILSGTGYFTFVSSMFLHGGFLHLLGNMLFFWIFADNVEDELGHLRFIICYLLLVLLQFSCTLRRPA